MKTINEEIAELRKRLDELEKQQSKGGVFVPEIGEKFWYIGIHGDVYSTSYNLRLLALNGNCYPTKEAAEQVVLNRKIHRFLQEQTDFVADWSVPEHKVYLFYDHLESKWNIEHFTSLQIANAVYFAEYYDAEVAAQAAIAKFGLEAFENYLRGSII